MKETQILFDRIFVLVIFLSCSVPTHAQEQSFNFEITPFGGYRYGGEFEETDRNFSIELDDKESYGLILNARHSPVTQWEILYSRQETSADTIGLGLSDPLLDISVEYLQAGGTSFFSFSLGLGLQIRPTDRLGIRLEARGYGTLLDSNSDLFCAFGPSNNVCAIRIDGTIMWQVEALAGIVFRF